jgi:hypothetical protein
MGRLNALRTVRASLSPLDRLSRQWLSAFARLRLPGNASTKQDGAGRVVGVDDVQHRVDDAMHWTPPLEFCHRATVTLGYDASASTRRNRVLVAAGPLPGDPACTTGPCLDIGPVPDPTGREDGDGLGKVSPSRTACAECRLALA